MFHDDESPASRDVVIRPGEDLEPYSLEELEERRQMMLDEIARIDAAAEKKRQGRSAADAVFKI
ncbi:DUF1192 family protein [Maricaulis sp. D1M11]|uniref:DUF1192 family protein n=1 Tax=Maricaulis sp. D1M11 TaxID=3076117 RepID=UPI0039B63B05